MEPVLLLYLYVEVRWESVPIEGISSDDTGNSFVNKKLKIMSTELIILIVGLLLILLALLDSLRIKGSSTGLIHPNLRISLGILGILLMIYAGYFYGSVNLHGQIEQPAVGNVLSVEYPVQRVQVISPIDGDSVKCRILTMGVYPENDENDIWVLLKPSDDKYYPQSDHTNTSYKRNGEWQVITRFGGDKGEAYELIVYETDSLGSAFFSATIQEWKDAETYTGLEPEDIPPGAVEVDRITVYLANNCRGVH
jgi:hypothetical protein